VRPPAPVAALLASGLLLSGTYAGLEGQDGLRLRPTAILADGSVVPALRLTARHESGALVIGPFPREWGWAVEADAPLTWDRRRNPEPLRAELRGGLHLSLFGPRVPPEGVPTPDHDPGPSHGYLAFHLRAAAEAPQRPSQADVAVGFSARFEHDEVDRLWFLPELGLGFGAVACVRCDLPEDEGRVHPRLEVEAGWNVPLDRAWTPDPLRPLWLRVRGRAFRTWGMSPAAEALRHERGGWGSAELAYAVDRAHRIQEVYVRWHGGDLPVRLRERRAWAAGITLFF
jgi:hypothetical protein